MSNITNDFISLLKTRQIHQRSAVTSATFDDLTAKLVLRRKRPTSTDAFMKEAYRLVDLINQLHGYLLRTRKVYLNIGWHTPSIASPLAQRAAADNGSPPSADGLLPLKDYPSMTDKERDEFDVQMQHLVRGFLSRTQTLEQMAGSLGTRDASVASPFGSYDESTANVHHQRLNEHRHAIVWMLQNRLMQVSRVQKEMQERRLEQRVQKQESLSHRRLLPKQSSSFKIGTTTPKHAPNTERNLSLTKLTSSLAASLVGGPIPPPQSSWRRSDEEGFRTPASGAMTPLEQEVASNKAQGQSEEENVELHLSEQERIFLENENAVMLAELESDLDQVRNATQSLQEIANLQTQMAHHLQTQQETIETLYQEAWTSNQTLENANKMLVKASKNFGDTRLWVLMFLLIASAVLLFLDYYG